MGFVQPSPVVSYASPDPRPLPATWECNLFDDSLIWSPGVYELFGLTPDTPLDRDAIVDMYLPESRAQLDRLRAAAIADCGSFTFEAQIRRADGELRWMRVSADVVARDGRATHLYGSKQDITDDMTRR
jgi:PAS domain S-box-containing protein